MVSGEASNGTWGVFTNFMYISTRSDASIDRTVRRVPVELDARVDTKSFTATLMGEYHIPMSDTVSFDVMAGARVWNVDNDISARLTAGGPALADFSDGDGASWDDPMIGIKTRINTNSPFYFTA